MSSNLKLAITTIGDLLFDNAITQDESQKRISQVNLQIPNYQRPYKWTAKNVVQLLDDIIEAKTSNKEVYRVGTLILHQAEKNQSLYNIVDGQQRVITFSLMLQAIQSLLKNDEKVTVQFLEQSLTDNPNNNRNIPSNYRTLDRRLGNMEEREREALLEYIKNNCELIVLITDDISEAFQFFDSQNARGKKLYPHDLLKAYHLREMNHLKTADLVASVKEWENLDQKKLSQLFSEYLYRLSEWMKGNKALELNEQNIHQFKGLTKKDSFPFAQYYKGAYAYADMVNQSSMPFVSGAQELKPFQLNAPIVAGKPFFDYAKHYFEILKDIQDNSKYLGYFINDNTIVKTLDLPKYKNGVGNRVVRLLFDTSILLYVDRFCPAQPSKSDLHMLDQFVVFAFVWSYSLRAQYTNLGWQSAQNYIMGQNDKVNAFNLFKVITDSDSPTNLFSVLSDKLSVLQNQHIEAKMENIDEVDETGVYQNYLYFFKSNKFIVS
jgi:hypothetical protein